LTVDSNLEDKCGVRLNRYLAMCGLGSRRKVEYLITDGKVKIDGLTVSDLSSRVDGSNIVTVNGEAVVRERNIYLVMNKPLGVVCAVRDRYYDTVSDLLPDKYKNKHVFPVGRLDRMTSGILILTNDGDLTQRIIHPSSSISKTYEVMLTREIRMADIEKWRKGLGIGGKYVKPLSVDVMKRIPKGQWIRIVLAEGVKREIRLMSRALGYRVKSLMRRKIGKMELVTLEKGHVMELNREKILGLIQDGGRI